MRGRGTRSKTGKKRETERGAKGGEKKGNKLGDEQIGIKEVREG